MSSLLLDGKSVPTFFRNILGLATVQKLLTSLNESSYFTSAVFSPSKMVFSVPREVKLKPFSLK